MQYGYPKCWWSEYLCGPKSHWPEKRKDVVVAQRSHVVGTCPYGVQTNYGLVHSELGVGHYYGHMVGHDVVSQV